MARKVAKTARDAPSQDDLAGFIDEIERRLELYDTECQKKRWELYLGGDAQPLRDCEQQRSELLLDEETWLVVMRWAAELRPTNPVWRRLILLGRRLISAQVDCRADVYELQHELEAEFLNTPPQLGHEQLSWGQFTALLDTHPDRSVREALWRSQVPVADRLRDTFLELVRRRNRWAREQGYDTYIDLALAPEGMSRDSVLERFVDLEEVTLDAYKSLLGRIRSWLGLSEAAIWDVGYLPEARLRPAEGLSPFLASSPDVVALIKALGIPWDSLHFAPQLTDRLPYPAFCWPVHSPDDVRLTISSQNGWAAYIEVARAFGQALPLGFTRQPTHLLRGQSPVYLAGMGAFLARVAADLSWLRRRRLLPDGRRARIDQLANDMLILRLRRLMAMSVFECRIYETPESDLDAAWGEIQEAFLLLSSLPWSGWAAQPDYILRPVHLPYEIIGELIASQAVNYLYQRFGSLFDNPELTEFIRETFYNNGSLLDWTDQVRAATGKFLSNKALFSEVAAEE